MLELNPSEFIHVLPLLAEISQKVLPSAICERINPGRIFVDRRVDPQVVLVWTPVGYYLLAGEPGAAQDLAALSQTLTDIFIPASQGMGETGFILVPSTPAWQAYLPTLLPGREVIEIYRRPFTFDAARFAAQANWRVNIPHGFHIEPVDAALAEQVGVLASWASLEDFLSNGMGFALLEGDEIASVCTSVFASQRGVEIDVHTAEKYQRRGFAVITASAFIEACLQQGKQPNWECFWDNDSSVALAAKLNFSPLPDYPVYFWEEMPSAENPS